MPHRSAGEATLVAALLALLAAAIVYPLLQVLSVAFLDGGVPTLRPLLAFFARPLFREAFVNTLLAGVLAVVIGSVIAVPLALLTVRYRFTGRTLVTVLGVLPLVIPPFVGAVAFQQILGRSGAVNLLLLEHAGFTIPFMEGLPGVVLVQSLHYFPFILLNTAAALAGLDRSLEEAAQNLGSSGPRLFRRVLLPLALPGYAAGALLTFIRVIDDLGTPLMLNYTKLLAPQAYVRVTTIGLTDVDGYVICVILVALSLGALALSKAALAGGEFAALGRAGEAPPVALGPRGALVAWGLVALLLGPALLPHAGILLLSVSRVWSLTPLPSGYTLGNYEEILVRSPQFIANTVRYAGLAALLDVALGAVIAWLLLRGRVRGRQWLDTIATVPLAIPGVVIAVGYLRAFGSFRVPGLGEPVTSTWLILVIVYAVRRLPYAVRGAYAALQQLSPALEEAAQNLGANRPRTFRRITLPLMVRGLLAGGLLAFITSAVDLSSTILLVPRVELGPLSYGIYLYMQSAVGRGPGAALGVVAIVLVAAGTWAATALARRSGAVLFPELTMASRVRTWVLPASMLIGTFAWSFVYVSLPFHIQKMSTLDASATLRWTGWILGISPLITVITAPISGRVGERIDPKRGFIAVQAFQGLGFLGMALARTLPEMLIARVLLGLMGAVSTFAFIMVGRSGGDVRRQVSYIQSGMTLGQVLGPAVGAVVAARLGFRLSFILGGAMLWACSALVAWGVPAGKPRDAKAAGDRRTSPRELVTVCLVVLTGSTQIFFLAAILPQILPPLGVSGDSTLEVGGFLLLITGLAAALGAMAAPRLAEVVGDRRALIWFLLGSSVLVAALGVAGNVWSFGVLRFLQVLCIAPIFPLSVAAIAQRASGEAIGFVNSARIGAAFIGPVVATTLLSSMPPAAVYLVLAGMGLSVVPLVARLNRRARPWGEGGRSA